jgi:hypothetical protein
MTPYGHPKRITLRKDEAEKNEDHLIHYLSMKIIPTLVSELIIKLILAKSITKSEFIQVFFCKMKQSDDEPYYCLSSQPVELYPNQRLFNKKDYDVELDELSEDFLCNLIYFKGNLVQEEIQLIVTPYKKEQRAI